MTSPTMVSISNSSGGSRDLSDSNDPVNSADGREWKKLSKQGAKILGACALVAFTVVAIAALAIGIAALVNPAGLALVGGAIGAFVTAGLAFAAENSMIVLIVGAVAVGLLSIAGIITLLANRCGLKSDDA